MHLVDSNYTVMEEVVCGLCELFKLSFALGIWTILHKHNSQIREREDRTKRGQQAVKGLQPRLLVSKRKSIARVTYHSFPIVFLSFLLRCGSLSLLSC